jgi:hypothetical protein
MAKLVIVNNATTSTSYSSNGGATWTTGYSGTTLVGTMENYSGSVPLSVGGNILLIGNSTNNVARSFDGINWTTYSRAGINGLDGRWLAHNGTIYLNLDGSNNYSATSTTAASAASWTSRSAVGFTITSPFVSGLCNNGSTFCALASGFVSTQAGIQTATSTDGITWTKGTIYTAGFPQLSGAATSICYDPNSGNYFVTAYAYTGTTYYPLLFRSTDGLTWSKVTLGPFTSTAALIPQSVCALPNSLVIVLCSGNSTNSFLNSTYYYSSTPLSSWSTATMPSSKNWRRVVPTAGGLAVAVNQSDSTVAYLTSASTPAWSTSSTLPSSNYAAPVASSEWIIKSATVTSAASVLIARVKLLVSAATVTSVASYLTSKVKSVFALATSSSITSAIFSHVKPVVAIALSIATAVYGKTLSLSQICSTISSSTGGNSVVSFLSRVWSLAYTGTKWVGVKSNTTSGAVTTTGQTWTATTLPASRQWTAIANDGTASVALALNSQYAASTTDGSTWTQRTLPSSRMWSAIAAGGSILVGVALQSDKCVVSTDHGVTWTEYSMPSKNQWTSIAWNGTIFCAISNQGVCATSTDGTTWSEHSTGSTVSFKCITWGLSQFTAIGPGRYGAKSADGITWTQINLGADADWSDIAPGIGDPNV